MQRPIVIGNWKTNKTVAESLGYMDTLINECRIDDYDNVDVVLTPTYMGLEAVRNFCFDSRVFIGAQNCDWHSSGSFCGGYPAGLLSEFCSYCFAGHSEQRLYYNNSDEQIRMEVKSIFKAGMIPVFCTGEPKYVLDEGTTKEYVGHQLEAVLGGLEFSGDLIVLYEPVWALGTGVHPQPAAIEETFRFIKDKCGSLISKENMKRTRFIYAGSINPDNAAQYFCLPSVDGLAVGSASLDPYKFAQIVRKVSSMSLLSEEKVSAKQKEEV